MTGPLPAFAEVLPGGARRLAEPTHGFALAVVPTTVGQYWHYLVDQHLDKGPAPRLHGFPVGAGTGIRTTEHGLLVLEEDGLGLPVTSVNWHGAAAYCRWLSERTGTGCRLPTTAEWCYAAAGPSGRLWSLGDEFDRALYAPPSSSPRPVCATPANSFGLHDLTGNVFEWCADALTEGSRVIKGGAYTVRNPESFANATVFSASELSTVPYIGFRVLRELPEL